MGCCGEKEIEKGEKVFFIYTKKLKEVKKTKLWSQKSILKRFVRKISNRKQFLYQKLLNTRVFS